MRAKAKSVIPLLYQIFLFHRQQIVVNFDEQIIFGQLEQDESAVWSLLVASGYLKVEEIEYRGLTLEPWYSLSITNLENCEHVFEYVQKLVCSGICQL